MKWIFKNRLIALMPLLFTVSCATSMRITPGVIPSAPPPTMEEKTTAQSLVNQCASKLSWKELPSGPEVKRVRIVTEKLTKAAGFPPNTFPVHVVDAGDEVNAMVVSGASVVVFTKLLERAHKDDELAVVLAHEVGHVVAGHNSQNKEQQGRADAVSIGSSILGAAAQVALIATGYSGAAKAAGNLTSTTTKLVGYGAIVRSFDRRQEYEADHLGLLIMAKAGYDPRVAIDFWKRAKQIFNEKQTSGNSFFSTHPTAEDRIDSMTKALPYALSLYNK